MTLCQRCAWAQGSELEQEYHDTEWGMPQTDDLVLFEFLILESAQAGLSWRTILEKRQGYRHHLAGFNPQRVANFSVAEREAMLHDPSVVRHAGKIDSAIRNAQVFLRLQQEYGSFARYIWSFVGGQPVQHHVQCASDIPAQTATSQTMSKALKKAGMSFVGPTICYAFMQATGMVNDHEVSCIRYTACQAAAKDLQLP